MPISVTQKDIADMALGLLGQEPLGSYDEDSRNGRTIRIFYESSRVGVLEDFPWSFSTTRQVLSPLSNTPVFGWDYQYALPGNFLKEQYVNNSSDINVRYKIEGQKLLCNESTVRFIYTRDVTLVSEYSAKCIELMAAKLAAKACYQITQSRTEEQALSRAYSALLVETMSSDAHGEGEARYEHSAGSWTSGI
jgi:hypothetical protein